MRRSPVAPLPHRRSALSWPSSRRPIFEIADWNVLAPSHCTLPSSKEEGAKVTPLRAAHKCRYVRVGGWGYWRLYEACWMSSRDDESAIVVRDAGSCWSFVCQAWQPEVRTSADLAVPWRPPDTALQYRPRSWTRIQPRRERIRVPPSLWSRSHSTTGPPTPFARSSSARQ